MLSFVNSPIERLMFSIFLLIALAIAAQPGHTREISDNVLRVADLTPGGKALYRRTLHQELTDVMGLIEAHYVDPLERKSLMQSCVEGVGAPWKDGEKIEKAFNRFIHSFDDLNADFARQKMLNCIDSMLKPLGPHNKYIDSEKMQRLIADAKTKEGIDISAIPHKDGYEVTHVGEESSAQFAGLRPGDVIVSVDGVPLAGLKAEQVEEMLYGKTGTVTKFAVIRLGDNTPLEIDVARVRSDMGKVESKLLENKIAFLSFRHLTSSTLSWFTASIQELLISSGGSVRGYVLDLRLCVGGQLPVSVGVSAAFLPGKSMVTELKGRTKDTTFKINADKSNYVRGKDPDPLAGLPQDLKTIPLVVIAGPRTSAGCEIIAAALQDNNRATVLGSQTAKLGLTSQYLRPLNFLSPRLKLTTGRIFRPNGQSIADVGVSPDILIDPKLPKETSGPDAALNRAIEEIRKQTKEWVSYFSMT